MNDSSLQSTGLKKTRGRIEILNYLKQISAPVDVSQIEEYLIDTRRVTMDTSNIYRNLLALYRNGLVKRFELQEGKFRYELTSRGDHHHLICEQCGAIEDISDCGIPALEKDIENKKKFKVTNHSLEFYGVCQKCQS